MDLKRVIIVIISIIIIAIIIFGVYFFIKEKNIQKEEITEYTPEEENVFLLKVLSNTF